MMSLDIERPVADVCIYVYAGFISLVLGETRMRGFSVSRRVRAPRACGVTRQKAAHA